MPRTNVFRAHNRNSQYENRLNNGYHASPWDVAAHVCEYLSGLLTAVDVAYLPALQFFHSVGWVGDAEFNELTADTNYNRAGKGTGYVVAVAFVWLGAGEVALQFAGRTIIITGDKLMAGFVAFCGAFQTFTAPRS